LESALHGTGEREVLWLDTTPALVQAIAAVGRGPIAVDTEADSFHHYREKVCLIQLSFGTTDALIDPLAGLDLTPLGSVLGEPAIRKVFHGGDYDVRLLGRDAGIEVRGLFDTMVAARLVGETAFGLAALLSKHFGVVLDKRWQRILPDYLQNLLAARLEVATEARYAPLIAGLPCVSEVLAVGRPTRAALGLIAEVRRRRYDLVVDFFGNPRTALITRLSGAAVRAGYDLRGRREAYTIAVPRAVSPESGEREYAADVHLRLAEAVGGVADHSGPAISLSGAARAEGAALLDRAGVGAPGRTVGLVASGTWATKSLPLSHVSVIASRLLADGWPVVLLSGPGEEHDAERLLQLNPQLQVLPGSDVATLAGVIAKLGAVVGTDSGPRHLAAALGVPSWAWFGPTHPDTWSPRGREHGYTWTLLPCRGCDRTSCPHWNCMPGLDPGLMATQILDHLRQHVRHASALGSAARA